MSKIFKTLILVFVFYGAAFGFNSNNKGAAQPEPNILVKKEKALKAPRPSHIPDEIIVKFKPDINENLIKALEKAHGVLEKYSSSFTKSKVFKIPKNKTVFQLVEVLEKSSLVEYVEPNYYAYSSMVPNDPLYFYQWHFDNDDHGGIQMEEAWDISTGNPNIVVAVIDTGVAYENYPGPNFWHIDTYNAYGGSGSSWWCGVSVVPSSWAALYGTAPTSPGYGNGWKQYLQRSFDLTSATGGVTFSYYYKYDIEYDFDFLYLDISENNGDTWTMLKQYTNKKGPSGGKPIDWTQDSVDLTGYKGKNILLRFRFNSDDSYSDEDGYFNSDGAVYIDEIKLEDDSGILFHDDVSGINAWENTQYEQAPDLSGTIFMSGYDYVNNDNHPNDDDGHGTHVTGTIAQTTNNSLGVAGIAFNTTIMPVKVLNSAGTGTYQMIADGIYYAVNNGADVINMSLGGSSAAVILEDAVNYAYDNGVVVIAASGNENLGQVSYPAAYNNVIAVGATQYDETRSSYSNYGSSLDLVAPGGGGSNGVVQQTFGNTVQDWGYWSYQGTSMAAPHVSGVTALLLSKNSNLTPSELKTILESTAEDKGDLGWDQYYGHGLLDAHAALTFTPVISISVENNVFDYGTLSLSPSVANPTKKSTVDLGKTPVIKNTGNVAVNLTVKSGDAEGGTVPWNLVVAENIAVDDFCHQYRIDNAASWYDFPVNNDYTGDIVTDLLVDAESTLDLQILMPTGSDNTAEKSITVTIMATESSS